MINYELAILIAVLSYTYTNLLTEPEMVFNGLYRFLDGRIPNWLFYPLIHCEKCNSAWVAIIAFSYSNWIGYVFYPLETLGYLALFTGFTIFTTYTLKQTYEKLWQK